MHLKWILRTQTVVQTESDTKIMAASRDEGLHQEIFRQVKQSR